VEKISLSQLLWPVVMVLGAYVLGSLPTAYLVAKKLKGIDIREHGSFNAGATNVRRVVGKKAGYFTLVVDFLKGLIAVLLARFLFPGMPLLHVLVVLAVVLGHTKSIFLGFTGGKAAITGLATMIALDPVAGLILSVIGVGVIKLSRFVSLGSMTAALFCPVVFYLRQNPWEYLVTATVTSLYVIYLHRSNIKRLIQGTENRLK
jgi:glycerol-3-phosphate acyltransferase PlsY